MISPFQQVKTAYKTLGADTDNAPKTPAVEPISIHRWQDDDVTGFVCGGAGGYISEVNLDR